jgi:hypothetical protein
VVRGPPQYFRFRCATISALMVPRLRSKCSFPEWQPEYDAAVAETDIEKQKTKTAALEDAIFIRLQEIAGKAGYETERDAIRLAIDTLRDIQKTKLGFPHGSNT